MTLLHTADWHLGHRLYDRDRSDEHRAALDWLLATIVAQRVDFVIVAGDVFDVTNPSNRARGLYYHFLGRLARTDCKGAVIIGGNHDSPALLDAPRDLLKSLNLHVVGAVRTQAAQGAGTQVRGEVVKLGGPHGAAPELIVAAVPYLRERDLRRGSFGENSDDRMAAIRRGIREHYRRAGTAAEAFRKNPTVPMVVTGHLFASGAEDNADKASHIYRADRDNIEAGQFPDCFDYVALGHVHRAQSVDGKAHVRYSGSLIPLTFVEGQRPRTVRLVQLGKAGEPVSSRKLEVPFFRRLVRVRGELEEVKARLRAEGGRLSPGIGRLSPGPSPWERGDEAGGDARFAREDLAAGVVTDHYWDVEQRHAKPILDFAKGMRKNPTPAEKKLWKYLRADGVGHKVYRQKPLGYAIADFFFPIKKVVVEVDGSYHDTPEMMWSDAVRNEKFERVGYLVLRFTNEEVLNDPVAVSDTIQAVLEQRPDRVYSFPREVISSPSQTQPASMHERSEHPTPPTSPLSRGEGPGERRLKPWAEVRLLTDVRIPNLRQLLTETLREATGGDEKDLPVELVRISTERLSPAPAAAPENNRQLDDLDPEDVFTRLLAAAGTPPGHAEALVADFRDLRNWMADQSDAV